MINLKIKIIAPNKEVLNYLENFLHFFFKNKNLQNQNIKTVRLPDKYKNFVFLRSPHVNKKSKEHFFFVSKSRSIYLQISKLELYYFFLLIKKFENVINLEVTYKEE